MDHRGIVFRFLAGTGYFFLFDSVCAGCGSTQPSVQWVPEIFPWVLNGRNANLTTHIHLLFSLIQSGAEFPLFAAFLACAVRASLDKFQHNILQLTTNISLL
jgi:hypothetical protein